MDPIENVFESDERKTKQITTAANNNYIELNELTGEANAVREWKNNLQNIQMRMSMPILRRRPNSGRLCIGSGDIFAVVCPGQCFNCNDDDVDELDKLATELIDDGWCDGFRSSNSGIEWPKLSCPCGAKKNTRRKEMWSVRWSCEFIVIFFNKDCKCVKPYTRSAILNPTSELNVNDWTSDNTSVIHFISFIMEWNLWNKHT